MSRLSEFWGSVLGAWVATGLVWGVAMVSVSALSEPTSMEAVQHAVEQPLRVEPSEATGNGAVVRLPVNRPIAGPVNDVQVVPAAVPAS